MHTAYNIGIIGGADGPTAIFVTGRFPFEVILLLTAGLAILIFCLARKK